MQSLNAKSSFSSLFLCACLLLAGFFATACQSRVPAYRTPGASITPPLPGYVLVWDEEFNGASLDSTKWTVYSGPRRGAHNSRDAVTVRNGMLMITTFTEDSVHYTGFIDTADKFLTTYGWFEARIYFESSPGEWGAFWIQTPTMGNPVDDVKKAGAEIDVVEHRAVDSSGADISNSYAMNLHWDGYGASHKHAGGMGSPHAGSTPLQNGWHTYAVHWTAEGYTFLLDGVKQWASQSGVSHRAQFIKLTCEVQDASWAGSIPAGGYHSRSQSTTRMQVDWVRVWRSAH